MGIQGILALRDFTIRDPRYFVIWFLILEEKILKKNLKKKCYFFYHYYS